MIKLMKRILAVSGKYKGRIQLAFEIFAGQGSHYIGVPGTGRIL